MKKRKILSFLLSVAMISALAAGCKSKEETKQPDAETPKQEEPAKQEMDKTPVTLTFFNADLNFDVDFTDDIAKKITELTGVTLKITHPVGGDTNAIPLMIASGEYPDLIYAKGDTSKLVDADAIMDLRPWIEEKGENLKKLYGDYLERLSYSPDNNAIYTVGTNGVSTATWNPSGTFQLQHAVLKELGYPEIKNIYDLENAIREYKKKYPTIDGQETIGLSLMASDWRWYITLANPAGFALGIPDDGQWAIDDEKQEAKYKFTVEGMKEYYKWLNKMNAEGLLDPESFTHKYDAYIAKLSSGRVLGLADANWDYQDAVKSLVSAGKPERTWAPLAVVVDETKYKDPSLKNYGYSGGWGIAVAKNSPNAERALQFLDWMASDEAQVLLNWGIEGVHYKVENGKRVVLPEIQKQKNTDKDFSKKTGVGLYTYPFPMRGDGAKDSTGNYYTANSEEIYIANYNEAEKETLKAYGKRIWSDFFPQPEELGVSKHGQAWQFNIPSDSDLAIIQKKADDYMQNALAQLVLGKPENFDAAWDKIQQDLKNMDIEKANADMTELTKERIEFWNK
ncbi:ABC transporter substrate-binding protein [Clostridium thermarum]|uniref:ABC transporter substrate-binding protein n=1 Tax=Clostridium thermarum TaxID=1716543 RepID=UPI00111E76E2|nr:ABC transporter substrate-binding protein [Clostridium thermarum]